MEWVITEDDRQWHVAQTATTCRWGRRWWLATAVALLFLLAAGGWLWHQAHAGLSQIETELQIAVEAAQWRAERDRRIEAKPIGRIPGSAEGEQPPGVANVQLLDLRKESAIVQVTTMQGASSYRQTQFYRRGVSGWFATAPSADSWGPPRTLETTYFIFHYHALDADAVAEAATKLDAVYPDLVASYPLDPTGGGKRHIWVSPEYSVDETADRTSGSALEIASPAIYLAPTEIGAGNILAQAVLLDLLKPLVNQSLERRFPEGSHDYQGRARVFALLKSLGLWQLWSAELPLAALHKPTIQWIYGDVQGERAPPAFDAKLCPLHQLWRAAPKAIQIPLFCGDPKYLMRYEVGRYLPMTLPRSLAETHLFAGTTPDEPYRIHVEAEQLGLVTLFDYAAATYGRQSLSALIANAASHTTWQTLVPATFGVSSTDFETGWQAHLRNHYGVPAYVTP